MTSIEIKHKVLVQFHFLSKLNASKRKCTHAYIRKARDTTQPL